MFFSQNIDVFIFFVIVYIRLITLFMLLNVTSGILNKHVKFTLYYSWCDRTQTSDCTIHEMYKYFTYWRIWIC